MAVATWVFLEASVNNLILIVSVPSVLKSLARVWLKTAFPLAAIDTCPVREPAEKSPEVIPVPDKLQYRVVFSET